MRKLLVFQHVPYEPLGTLDQQFRAAGFRIRYVNFHRQPEARPALGRYHGLVVLGGPHAADQTDRYPHLAVECDAIHSAVELGMPVLGICLGAQLIARCLGARTLRGVAPEVGWHAVEPTAAGRDDPLIGHFGAREMIFQWHADTFTLPSSVRRLASSMLCENQAFCYRDSVYGLQFHLEVDSALIRRWLTTPVHQRELAQAPGLTNPARLLEETELYMPRSRSLSEQVFGEFINRFYRLRRRAALPSR
jgi:GMP synthase (glutamine-hydrolysing)